MPNLRAQAVHSGLPGRGLPLEGERLRISYENCLETGACRIACETMGNRALVWAYPVAGRGVHYRFG